MTPQFNIEGQYQPGSEGLVLLNKQAITDPQKMADTELEHWMICMMRCYQVLK